MIFYRFIDIRRSLPLLLALLFFVPVDGTARQVDEPVVRADHRATTTVQRFTTPGGMTVLLSESHANPMVEVRLLAPGGGAHDPAGKAGVASLTAWMFNEGGGEMDSETFQERLAFYGIALGADAAKETLEVELTTLTEHLEEAWARLADALLRPRFDDKDFQRARNERIADLTKSLESPGFRAGRAFYRKLYGDHPYAEPVSGTLESVPRIELADVKRRHEAAFRAPDMVMAVAGDIDMNRLKSLITKHLSGLNPEPGPFKPLPTAKNPPAGGHEHIEMDIPQTTLRLGILGIDREDPDYYAFLVMNQIFGGGGLSSRLNEEIREKRGLAYGIFSYLLMLPSRGPFVIGTKTKTASVAESLEIIKKEVRRLVEKGVTETELTETKRYLTGSFPLRLDGLDKLAGNWSAIGYYKRGWDYLDKWPERIRAVSRESIQRAAKRLLDLDKFQIVTVGRPLAKPQPAP